MGRVTTVARSPRLGVIALALRAPRGGVRPRAVTVAVDRAVRRPKRAELPLRTGGGLRGGSARDRRHCDGHDEPAAGRRRRVDARGAAHRDRELADDREAEAGADRAARSVAAGVEPLEHAIADVGRNAGAVVGDRDGDRVADASVPRCRSPPTVDGACARTSARSRRGWRRSARAGRGRGRQGSRGPSAIDNAMPRSVGVRAERLDRVAHDAAASTARGCSENWWLSRRERSSRSRDEPFEPARPPT